MDNARWAIQTNLSKHFVLIHNELMPEHTKFTLEGLNTSGRCDMVARVVQSALFLSHGTRRDVIVWICFEKHNKSIGFHGDLIRHLRPDERNIADLLQKAFYWDDEDRVQTPDKLPRKLKCLKGIFWIGGGFKELHNLYEAVTIDWIYLVEDGKPVSALRSISETCNKQLGFIFGDSNGLHEEQEEFINVKAAHKLNLGEQSLLASHCVVIILFLLDNKLCNSL